MGMAPLKRKQTKQEPRTRKHPRKGLEFYSENVRPERTGITLHWSGWSPDSAHWNYPDYFNSSWRLYYNSHRGHCLQFGERIIELTPDHIVLVPSHCRYHCFGEKPTPAFWLTFTFTRRLHPDQEIPALLEPRDTELCLIRDLRALIEVEKTPEIDSSVYRNSLALIQVIMSRSELKWSPPMPQNLIQTLHYIETHIDEKLLNPTLARQAGMSVEGFARAFKHHIDTTPARFVAEVRMREACHLLLQSDETIDDIAEATGFPDRACFSRVFKKIIRKSPAAFRRSHS